MHPIQQNLLAIIDGDSSSRSPEVRSRTSRLLAGEDGLMSWATLLAVVCFCALIGMMFNLGRITNDKLQVQNAADSAAYSASLVQARALNAITAANHMMGELTALYVMHHAIGGKVLDDNDEMDNWVVWTLNALIWTAHKVAWLGYGATIPFSLGNEPAGYGPATDIPRGEASVYDAKCLLKEKILEEYISHIGGSSKIMRGEALLGSILFAAKGIKMIIDGRNQQARANQEIRALVREYRFINTLESFAIATRPLKKRVIPAILDALWLYERTVAGPAPKLSGRWQAAEAAEFAAEKNKCVGEALGRPTLENFAFGTAGLGSTELPVVQDPTTESERTQLMRATYPWVQDWRSPLLLGFDLLAPRSRVARFYEYHCDRYAKETCEEFRERRGYNLYVLNDMNADEEDTDKGTEPWRFDSSYANELYCVVGVARNQRSPVMTQIHWMPDTNPTPISAMSEAMAYNANRPEEWEPENFVDRGLAFLLGREAQPVSGWDTLNWTEGATEWKNGKWYFEPLPDDLRWIMGRITALDVVSPPDIRIPGIGGPPEPKVELNWQAKLVPIAQLNLLKRTLMTQDRQIRDRILQQAVPGIGFDKLGINVINH